MKQGATPRSPRASQKELHTLGIDVGGTGLKASVLDARGHMVADRVHVETPYPCTPKILVGALTGLVAPLPPFDRVSVGFPGVVRDGKVITAPHFGNRRWRGYALAGTLSKRLGKPVRLLNDAEVQGLGIIRGQGLELVLTLGTGAGTALFRNGLLMPHLELAQHPVHGHKTYNGYVGNEALEKLGEKKWSRHVLASIKILSKLINYDRLYLGGGNAGKVRGLPREVEVVSNDAGITGGVRLWDSETANEFPAGAF